MHTPQQQQLVAFGMWFFLAVWRHLTLSVVVSVSHTTTTRNTGHDLLCAAVQHLCVHPLQRPAVSDRLLSSNQYAGGMQLLHHSCLTVQPSQHPSSRLLLPTPHPPSPLSAFCRSCCCHHPPTHPPTHSMQFGHRVKSVTLADYSAHEVELMQQGGNQVWLVWWLVVCLLEWVVAVSLRLLVPQGGPHNQHTTTTYTHCAVLRCAVPCCVFAHTYTSTTQVAAYRWLARYTPGKDLPKPTDRCVCVCDGCYCVWDNALVYAVCVSVSFCSTMR